MRKLCIPKHFPSFFTLAFICTIWAISGIAAAYPTLTTPTITVLDDIPKGDYVMARDGGLGFRFAPKPPLKSRLLPRWILRRGEEFTPRNVFLFGDTALSQPNSAGTRWAVNTMYSTTDSNPEDGIGGGHNYKQAGQAADQWVPWTQAEAGYSSSGLGIVGLWPTGPFKDPETDKTYIWFGKVLEHPGKGFDGVGTGFCEVKSLHEPPSRIQHRPGETEDYLMFLYGDGKTTEGCYGTMAVVSKDHLYTYDWQGANWGRVLVARAPLKKEAFKNRTEWRFWNGSDWTAEASAAKPIMDAGGAGTIAWNNYLKCYLYTHMEYLGKRMVMRLADNPWGPWSRPFYIYTATAGPKGETPYSGYSLEMLQRENGRTLYTAYSIPDASSWTGGRIAVVQVRLQKRNDK